VTKLRLPFSVIVTDVETGGKPENRIVEIGAVRVTENFEIAEQFSMYVKPPEAIKTDAFQIHGISDTDVQAAPSFKLASQQFIEWCDQWKPFALGTWSDFDVVTLRDEHRRIGGVYPYPGHVLDVKSVVWWDCLKRGHFSRTLPVDRACSILGIPHELPKHRALADALTEAKLFRFVALSGAVPADVG
jgi:DNA polymerase III epsilon subunit-like protein